ncbi:NAD(P)/FAD-dependent oxidoreductase [Caldalkalibacillus mannanilyticus]|uniref:NAD(P)/FAD-dependent oxidoreductase n=1 Tax=Caldalkalibacillus mannanilyticus TaxID=1418 RepID=UPI000469A633|nr:FAD-dependent oxidoreductase [Caldalkalibacillus mannanilyticus]
MKQADDVLIIGAGPAGLSAAIACAENGLTVSIMDEFYLPGGRLLGQLHQEPDGAWWNGIAEAEKLLKQIDTYKIKIHCGVSVYHLEAEKDSWVVHTNRGRMMTANVLIATGAAEVSNPLSGWTLPGVMSIGAAQVMTNVQRVSIGKKGIIVGINILGMAIARELQLANIQLHSMVLPQPNPITNKASTPLHVFESLLHLAHLAPSPFLRWGARLMKPRFLRKTAVQLYPKQGVNIEGLSVQMRKAALRIIGKSQVEGIILADLTRDGKVIPGTETTHAVDFVCLAGGLYPLAELAAIAGCPFYYIPELGGHVPLHNERMETPLKGLYVAGNITGIESAKIAMAQGRTAGLSIANTHADLAGSLEEKIEQAVQEVHKARKASVIQFHPDIHEGRQRLYSLYEDFVQSPIGGNL